MLEKIPPLTYELTRVSIFFSFKENTVAVFYKTIVQLYKDYGGCTISLSNPCVFKGYWLEPLKTEPQADKIVWIIVDVNQKLDDPRLRYFSELKNWLEKTTEEGEIWITCHSLYRFINFPLLSSSKG